MMTECPISGSANFHYVVKVIPARVCFFTENASPILLTPISIVVMILSMQQRCRDHDIAWKCCLVTSVVRDFPELV